MSHHHHHHYHNGGNNGHNHNNNYRHDDNENSEGDDTVYEVNLLWGRKYRNNRLEWHVRWAHPYTRDDDTWEPEHCLNDYLIEDFNRQVFEQEKRFYRIRERHRQEKLNERMRKRMRLSSGGGGGQQQRDGDGRRQDDEDDDEIEITDHRSNSGALDGTRPVVPRKRSNLIDDDDDDGETEKGDDGGQQGATTPLPPTSNGEGRVSRSQPPEEASATSSNRSPTAHDWTNNGSGSMMVHHRMPQHQTVATPTATSPIHIINEDDEESEELDLNK